MSRTVTLQTSMSVTIPWQLTSYVLQRSLEWSTWLTTVIKLQITGWTIDIRFPAKPRCVCPPPAPAPRPDRLCGQPSPFRTSAKARSPGLQLPGRADRLHPMPMLPISAAIFIFPRKSFGLVLIKQRERRTLPFYIYHTFFNRNWRLGRQLLSVSDQSAQRSVDKQKGRLCSEAARQKHLQLKCVVKVRTSSYVVLQPKRRVDPCSLARYLIYNIHCSSFLYLWNLIFAGTYKNPPQQRGRNSLQPNPSVASWQWNDTVAAT